MTVSATSQLFEKLSEELLSEDELFTIKLIDGLSEELMYEKQIPLKNPFAFDFSRFVPNEQNMDLPRFLEVAVELLDKLQELEGVQSGARVQLVADFQPEQMQILGDEVITYKVVKRTPANMNTKGTSRPQRGAGFQYDLRSPNNPNKIIVVESRPIDHVIQFACWSKNADKANSRALWLEKNFIGHAWAFKVQGAERFFWKERLADTYWTTGGQRLHQRPLNFFVRLREFQNRAYPIIRTIDLQVKNTN